MFDINKQRLIGTFIDLVKISSPSWKEEKIRDYIQHSLKKLPVTCKQLKCGDSYNLLIAMEGDTERKPALFSGHMDTVAPCDNVKPVISPSKISSDGTTILGSDDKAAIAMFMEGLFFIAETGMAHGPVEILLSCAEEVGLHGIKDFDMSALRSKYAFVFDSDGSIGKIVLKAPYHSTMTIRVAGKAAHAGMEPEKGINAINVLSEIITRLPSGRIDHETTMNVGTVSGGRATNIVAEEATCVLEVRSIDRKKLVRQEAIIRDLAKKTTSRFGTRSNITRTLEYSGFSIRPEDPITRIVAGAMKRIGISPQFEISGGGSDTNVFNKAGIKAINIAAGMQSVHTTKEYILIKDLVEGARLMLSIITII